MCLINVIFSNSCIFLFRTFLRHVPCFSIAIKLHFSSSSSSSTYGKIISSSIVSSYRASSSLCLIVIFSSFSSGLMELFSDSSSSSVRDFSYIMLNLLPCPLFLNLHGYLIRILHISHCHHANLILDFIPQSINVPRNFFFIILPVSCSYVQLIKLFGILFHRKNFMSQMLKLPEHI
jgi:hypothetical protein